ncbi:unnamed protein product, partial [Mesorhabditis spiculigera]
MRIALLLLAVFGLATTRVVKREAMPNDEDLTAATEAATTTVKPEVSGTSAWSEHEILAKILSDPAKKKKLDALNQEYQLKLLALFHEQESEMGVVLEKHKKKKEKKDKKKEDKKEPELPTTASTTPSTTPVTTAVTTGKPKEKVTQKKEAATSPRPKALSQKTSLRTGKSEEYDDQVTSADVSGQAEDSEELSSASLEAASKIIRRKQQADRQKKSAAKKALKAKLKKMSPGERHKWHQAKKEAEAKGKRQVKREEEAKKKAAEAGKPDPLKEFFESLKPENAKRTWEKLFPALTTKAPEPAKPDAKKP